MSFYSHITLRKVGAPLIPYKTKDYTTPEQKEITRYRHDEIVLTGYQNFHALDDLITQYGRPAEDPNFDPSKPESAWNNPRYSGRLLDLSDVQQIASAMEPLYKVLLPLPDKALEAIDESDYGILEAILGSKAKAKALEKAVDAAAYGTPFYLCCDSFFTHKFMDAARTFLFLAGSELPIVKDQDKDEAPKEGKPTFLVYYYGA